MTHARTSSVINFELDTSAISAFVDDPDHDGEDLDMGNLLSVLSMYNYLNSKFTESEITVSSPRSTNNSMVKYQHYSVNAGGTGIMRFIYLIDAAALLFAISIVGYGYGFSMLVANLKVLFQIEYIRLLYIDLR